MYLYTPDEVAWERANHQPKIQNSDEIDSKRRGNLGEFAFEQFCREYLPVEMWEWKNEETLRRYNPESVSAYDFEVFGYEVDVETSRNASAFRPDDLLDADPDENAIAMVWHRDDEDSLFLLGWAPGRSSEMVVIHPGLKRTRPVVVPDRGMSRQEHDAGPEKTAAEILAERTGRTVEDFEYDGEIPDLDELETRLVDDEE